MPVAEQIHHLHRPQCKHHSQHRRNGSAYHNSHADGTVDALHISLAPVLADQNAQSTLDAEDNTDQQKHRHIGCGHCRHFLVAQLTDHEGVDQAKGKGDQVL